MGYLLRLVAYNNCLGAIPKSATSRLLRACYGVILHEYGV